MTIYERFLSDGSSDLEVRYRVRDETGFELEFSPLYLPYAPHIPWLIFEKKIGNDPWLPLKR